LNDFFQQHKEFNSFSAAWHPDGRRITVWIDDPLRSGSTPDFWTIPLDGGPAVYTEIGAPIEQQFRELAAPSANEWLVDSNFAWAPSGDALYFERTFRGARSLWRLNVNPRTMQATSVKQLTAGEALDTDPAVSRDGKRLAFTAASGRVSIWLYPFNSERGKITGAGRAVTSPGLDAWLPSESPDDSRLVFSGVRAGETRLWLKSLPDGRETPLFVDGYSRNNAQWSRDGTHLAYLRIAHNPEEGQLVTWSAATRQEEPLTAPGSSAADRLQLVYDWSSDDTSLLVTKAMPNGSTPEVRYEAPGDSINVAVWQVPVSAAPHAESKERLLISGPAYKIYQPHQSPDGRWIVFEAAQKRPQDLTRTQPSSLYVMRASGGPWLPIIVGENWADKPRWSPDGQTIYFLWDQGSFFNVWGIRFDPETGKTRGHPFQVTTLDNPALMIPRHMGSVEMSVTRNNLALTLGQLSGGIWILDNVDR
jgi:Tol biopolymer transport system component